MDHNLIDAGIAYCEFLLEAQAKFGGELVINEVKGSYREVTLKLGSSTVTMLHHPAIQDLECIYCSIIYSFTGNNIIETIDSIKMSMAEDGYHF
jgi:hypothetical protein